MKYVKPIGVALVIGAILILVSYPLLFSMPRAPSVTVEATPAKEVAKSVVTPLKIEMIKVYPSEVKAHLKLPDSVVKAPNKHAVASSKVGGDDRPHTVTTVVDEQTGEFITYDRIDPLPWMQVRTTTHFAAYYGLKNMDQVIRLQAQQELLQLKALHIEAIATVDVFPGGGSPDTFIGVGGRWSF